ncbi:MAG: plastocyanin/azurin family copper-binding protein [Planctomycetota bacterium]
MIATDSRLRLLLLACLLCPAASLRAADVTIEMFQSAFLPQFVSVELGDTVTWQRVAGTHNLKSGTPNGAAGTADEPGAVFDVVLDATNPTFSFSFATYQAGGLSFFDATNPIQIGFVQLVADEDEFLVTVVDNAFLPSRIEIFEGDSVRWEHEVGEMPHTVTSGLTSDPADDPGLLFDELSTDGLPIFVHPFATPGRYPYFCRPHEVLGMNGTVVVQARFIRGDASRDGIVDTADAVVALGHIFNAQPAPCVDALDVDDDGNVNVTDVVLLVQHLFVTGLPPAAPFPLEGADRTADGNLCEG